MHFYCYLGVKTENQKGDGISQKYQSSNVRSFHGTTFKVRFVYKIGFVRRFSDTMYLVSFTVGLSLGRKTFDSKLVTATRNITQLWMRFSHHSDEVERQTRGVLKIAWHVD